MAHNHVRHSRASTSTGWKKYATPRPRVPIDLGDVDFDEFEPGSSTHSSKRRSTKTEKSQATRKTSPKTASIMYEDAVSNPMPGAGLTSSELVGTISIPTGVLPVAMPSTTAISALKHTQGLPPYPATTTGTTGSTSYDPASATPHSASDNAQYSPIASPSPSGHISTVIIVLIAVGGALFLLLVCVIWRACAMPKRRSCPTPSLPILQDPFADHSAVGDEESLFGGKERLSGRPGSRLTWNWTQYSHPSLVKPVATASGGQTAPVLAEKSTAQCGNSISPRMTEKAAQPQYLQPPSVPSTPNLTGRLTKRVSTLSTSMYPGTPQSTYGIAVGSASPLTADGMPLLQRSVSKASTRRQSKSRYSLQYALQEKREGTEEIGGADPYDGLAAASQPTPALKKSNTVGHGRARVKAPYAPGTVVRASSTMGAMAAQTNPFDDSQYVLPPLSPAMKTEACRERDTKALTTALGLASPTPLSPPTTICPDDSVTLAGDRRKSRSTSQARVRAQSQILSPSMEASARLGNLMLAEFSSMTSLPSTRTVAGTADTGGARSGSSRKRADDKPPRVPSPPPLPSLAQMALAHTNPEEYSDYRSPTYSIYGLYEASRKSRGPGEGGY